MIRPVLALALAACAGSQASAPSNRSPTGIDWPETLDHASTSASHREAALALLDASGTKIVMKSMIDVTMKTQLEQNPGLRPFEGVMREFFGRYLSYESLRGDMAKFYMDRFSELQLRQMTAFYRTTTGQLAVHELPQLIQAGAQLGAARVQEHQAELVEMVQREQAKQSKP